MTDQLTDDAVKTLLDGTTPGPLEQLIDDFGWSAEFDEGDCAWIQIGPSGGPVIALTVARGHGGKRLDANAALFQAAPDLARALLDARAERDRLRADAQAANGVWQANLRLRAELADTQTQLGDWIVRADGANVMAEKAEAELAAAQAAQAMVVERAAEHIVSEGKRLAEGIPNAGPGLEFLCELADEIRAFADPTGVEALAALRKERDLAVAQNDRLWGANHKLVATQDAAEAESDRLAAELAAAQQREARLLAAIEEATDPDFILGAMDNVNDMDVTLDGFAQAASRAIRAALAHNGRGE